jgi:hypothetical protein
MPAGGPREREFAPNDWGVAVPRGGGSVDEATEQFPAQKVLVKASNSLP